MARKTYLFFQHFFFGYLFLLHIYILIFFSLLRNREFEFADPQTKLLCAFLLISALYLAATIIKWRTTPPAPPEESGNA